MFFSLALPFKVCECDVFMAVLPVHTIAPCFHLVYEVLSACGCFSAVHDRKGCILHITFHFSLFGLLQEVVCFFVPRNSFFPFLSGKGLSFLRNMKPLLPALFIAPVFQVLQIDHDRNCRKKGQDAFRRMAEAAVHCHGTYLRT